MYVDTSYGDEQHIIRNKIKQEYNKITVKRQIYNLKSKNATQ